MIPLGTVHQDDADPAAVANEALRTLGLKGIKLHPMMMGLSPADPRLRENPIRERPGVTGPHGIGIEYPIMTKNRGKERSNG
ncbi:MAG: hypothetical protein XU12_C0001G0206 [Deltaproteobacteria bacterium CSP1-8]|nr:MAG: hypothetical protein XU12_C0001G0206 [Deltaproteobacteria bacterium CSP1-8]